MEAEEIKKLNNIDLVGQLISHAHQFGDVIKETDDFAKEIICRLDALVSPQVINTAPNKIYLDDASLKVARKHPHYFCYTGSNMPEQHEVGCSHKIWTKEQLQESLDLSKAVLRVYQHKLFGTPLE